MIGPAFLTVLAASILGAHLCEDVLIRIPDRWARVCLGVGRAAYVAGGVWLVVVGIIVGVGR